MPPSTPEMRWMEFTDFVCSLCGHTWGNPRVGIYTSCRDIRVICLSCKKSIRLPFPVREGWRDSGAWVEPTFMRCPEKGCVRPWRNPDGGLRVESTHVPGTCPACLKTTPQECAPYIPPKVTEPPMKIDPEEDLSDLFPAPSRPKMVVEPEDDLWDLFGPAHPPVDAVEAPPLVQGPGGQAPPVDRLSLDPANRYAQMVEPVPETPSRPVPQEMLDYLKALASPPEGWLKGGEAQILTCMEGLGSLDLSKFPDSHFHAALIQGTPSEDLAAEILRVLRPGGHCFLFAPDHSPMGFEGACRAEDAGFEVRDAILWVREAGGVHYEPKAKTHKQRAAGLGGKNFHATVKPTDLLVGLMADAPKDEVILDPFLGSGSGGLAALQTGHDFIGVEQHKPYLEELADPRIKHGIRDHHGWVPVDLISDIDPPPVVEKAQDMDDFFGWGQEE